MKRIIYISMILVLVFCLASCGGKKEEPKEFEIAMISDTRDMEDGSFTQISWETIEDFAKINGLTAKCYKPAEVQELKEGEVPKEGVPTTKEEAYMQAVQKAVDKKAKLIIMTGSNFETTVYAAQAMYPEVYFLIIDGVPHDAALTYGNAANTMSIVFAEEEAGYMAGYAAVKDGYKKLGFMGGQELPAVKRYGYGFVQGVAAAAAEMEKKVELSYVYTGTFNASEEVQKAAEGWYKNGTEVIFACGGAMGTSVMDAAEKKGGKVIGVDVDQSYLSDTVITSAKKNIDTVLTEMLQNYVDEKFVGGTAFNYTAKNGGIDLEMDNDHFNRFNDDDYKKVVRQLKNGKIQLKKDTGVGAVTELTGEWVTIK